MSGTFTIAIGSKREPKISAVKEAFASVGPMLESGAEFEFLGFDVPSGVRHTPLNRQESMQGARARVQALEELNRERDAKWQFLVGLEGGLDVLGNGRSRLVMLENWVCVAGPDGQITWGRSGGIQVPESLAVEVVDHGVELASAVDAFAGETGIRDAQGAWGVLSRNLITRQEAFRVALVAALAPFFNPRAYRPLAAGVRGSHSNGGG